MTVRHRPNDPAARPTIPESERENQFRVEGTSHAGDRSTAELVSDMSEQAARLLRIEARLAVREVLRKSKRGVAGGKFLAAAASLTLYGVGALVACFVLALALVMPGWAAALVVGGALLAIAGVLALIGRALLRRAVPPTPEKTMESVREDLHAMRGRAEP